MPQHDSLINNSSTSDSSASQLIGDSLNQLSDSNSSAKANYWHKKFIFHYEYSPFKPIETNIQKLFVYKPTITPHFEAEMLIVDKNQIKVKIDSTNSLPLIDSTLITKKDTIVDTIANVRFQIPTNYFPHDTFTDFKSIGIPKAFQQLDSFNNVNNVKSIIHFGKKVYQPDKTYFEKSEYIKIETNNNLKINWAERDWMFWPLMGLISFFILIRYRHRSFINQTVTSIFYPRMSVRLFKEKNESTAPIIQSLLFFYFLTTGMFVFMAMNYYGLYITYTNGFFSFIIYSLLLTLIYYLKISSIRILGYVFQQRKVVDEYVHNLKLFNISTAIVLLPLVICIPFLNTYLFGEEHLIQSGFAIYILILLFKLIRGFLISYRQSVSIFYILLYLCTLEILPLALLLRVVTL